MIIDWTSVINTFLATLPLTIASITGLLVVLRKVEEIRHATNSMKDALVKAAGIIGHAKGVAEERQRKEGVDE